MSEISKEVTIYTDGGAEPNPGPGGFGVVLIYGDRRLELSGGFQKTTNNRMEVFAAIKGLQTLKQPCKVKLYSDSKYLVEAMTKGWVLAWERRKWHRHRNKQVVNADLWEILLALCQTHEVYFEWIKGHAGHKENERCDVLSMQFLQMKNLEIDEVYEASQKMKSSKFLPDIPSNDTASLAHRSGKKKVTVEGQSCPKCKTPVVKRTPRRRQPRSGHEYYYEYYLYCPKCKTMYMPEEAKRSFERVSTVLPPSQD